jgi:hypothetical protein
MAHLAARASLGQQAAVPGAARLLLRVLTRLGRELLSHALTTAPWHLGDANILLPDPQALYYGPAASVQRSTRFPPTR